jgi:hypothetical protein
MRTHLRHLCSKKFPMISGIPQSDGFWPMKSLSKNLEVHRDSNSQNGSSLGSVSVHSLTLSYTFNLLGTWNVIPWFHSWPAPLQALALVISPRLGLQQVEYFVHVYEIFLSMWKEYSVYVEDILFKIFVRFTKIQLACSLFTTPKLTIHVHTITQ